MDVREARLSSRCRTSSRSRGSTTFPSLLVAHPSTGIKTVADLIKVAKEKPGTLNYSSGGVGNFSHLGLAVLAFKTGINIVHVPYRGVGPATQAIVAGDVQLMYNNVATALPHVEAGKLNGLAVGGEQRFPALPNVPTVAETVPGFDVTPWVGLFVPAKTPKEVVARLSKEVDALLKDPEVVKIFQTSMIKASLSRQRAVHRSRSRRRRTTGRR